MRAGPNCKSTQTKTVLADQVPEICDMCKAPVKPKTVEVEVCTVSGMRAGPNCKSTQTKTVLADQVPGICGICKAPVKPKTVDVEVCTVSGMRAGPNCKSTQTKTVLADQVPGICGVCKAPTAPSLSPDDVTLRIAQALRAIDESKYADASRIVEEIVSADSSNGEAWHIKGVTRFFQDKFTDAEACFKKAIEYGYDRASVRDDLAYTYWMLAAKNTRGAKGYMSSALDQAYKSLNLSPGNPWAYNVIGCVTFTTAGKDRAKLRVAADAFKKAAELITGEPLLLDNAANALAQLHELVEAERYAKASVTAAAKNNEPYPDAYETLSKIAQVRGDKESAKHYHELYLAARGKN
jgi:tetratricopeptide (TPR) repeat protein